MRSDTDEEEEEGEEEAREEELDASKKPKKFQRPTEPTEPTEPKEHKVSQVSQVSQVSKVSKLSGELASERRRARWARNEAMQSLRDLYDEQMAEHQERKRKRDLLRWRPVLLPVKKNKGKQKKIRGAYDIEVPPEPMDEPIVDNGKKLERLKRYNYPAKHCHHIDLRFVGFFDQLTSLTFEFLGPRHNPNFHQRHLNFSYADMSRLAKGLRTLSHLKIFRLRNSRMDGWKLIILSRALKNLDSLETVDFGGDQLGDDCNIGLGILLDRRFMLRSLELENNNLGRLAMESVGNALRQQEAHDGEAGGTLKYLGLGHNPVGELGLQQLVDDIIGTQHVQELNIIGLEQITPATIVSEVCNLLRKHAPILSIQMMGNVLNEAVGIKLLRALEQNHKILFFDCRGCDLSFEQEFQADVILRRNAYVAKNTYLGDSSYTEEALLKLLLSRRHPIREKYEKDRSKLDYCHLNRPAISKLSNQQIVEEVEEEEQPREPSQEYDIWKAFGIGGDKPSKEVFVESYRNSSESVFVYNPSAFNLDETREHINTFGPSDRYYIFQRKRTDHFFLS